MTSGKPPRFLHAPNAATQTGGPPPLPGRPRRKVESLKRALTALVAAAMLAGGVAFAAEPVARPADYLFAKTILLRGTLGEKSIQARIGPKVPIEDGIEGDYIVYGRSGKVLLAGELDGDELFLEESQNGTDISGQWEGKRIGDTLSGSWNSADGSVILPFMLKIVPARPEAKSPPKPVRKPAAQ